MSLKRNKYTAAHKAKIALEALSGTKTTSELCSQYKIHATQISLWKKQLKEGVTDIFSKKRDGENTILVAEDGNGVITLTVNDFDFG